MNEAEISSFQDDYLIGLLAVRKGYATQAQLDEAVAIRVRSHPKPRLIDVLVDLCKILPAARYQLFETFRQLLLGSITVRLGYLTQPQLKEVLEIQQRSNPKPLLGAILVALGRINKNTLLKLLEEQESALTTTLLVAHTRHDRKQLARQLHRRRIMLKEMDVNVTESSLRIWLGLAAGFLFLTITAILLKRDTTSITSTITYNKFNQATSDELGQTLKINDNRTFNNNTLPDRLSTLALNHTPDADNTLFSTPAASDIQLTKITSITKDINKVSDDISIAKSDNNATNEINNNLSDPSKYRIIWDNDLWIKLIEELQALRSSPPSPAKPVIYLGEDHQTQGSWIGRYGTYSYILPAMMAPFDITWSQGLRGKSINYSFYIGENTKYFNGRPDSIRRWVHALNWNDPRVLQNPDDLPHRRQAEIDNHQEAYPFMYQDINVYQMWP